LVEERCANSADSIRRRRRFFNPTKEIALASARPSVHIYQVLNATEEIALT
jgi:hypothetical protein